VSAQTFWLTRALARQGHSVHVVTNAASVEPSFQQLLFGRDKEILHGTADGARIDLRMTTPLAPYSYIPFAPPYVTQLFGLARAVVSDRRVEAILGWYYEPYGFVAALVGRASDIPVFLRHAGSDLARLSENPDLHEAYRWALGVATGLIVTNEREFDQRYTGIQQLRLRVRRPGLPAEFSPHGDRLDVAEVWPVADEWFGRQGLASDLVDGVRRLNAGKPFNENTFTIGTTARSARPRAATV
jgi:hypothetical protein